MWQGSDIWLPSYLQHPKRHQFTRPTDVMIAICDHFSPLHQTNKKGAIKRLKDWNSRFPELTRSFRDNTGHPPKQTFFYPVEEYDPDLLDEIAQLCQSTGSEVEIRLHHDDDTEENFRDSLTQGQADLVKHQLLSVDAEDQTTFGFIHGNGALDNSDPNGRNCGIQRELQVLRESGCYGDFTMPTAPHRTQTQMVNKIYYAVETESAKSHNHGYLVTAPQNPSKKPQEGNRPTADLRSRLDHLLLVQGPLGLNCERRKWGIFPRLENADLTGNNPPTPDRLSIWLRNAIHVQNRPDWIFIKLHCHGAINPNREMLLGKSMHRFHEHLANQFGPSSPFRIHYVSARELVNIVHAAEDGHTGNPSHFRNYLLKSRIPFQKHCLPDSV